MGIVKLNNLRVLEKKLGEIINEWYLVQSPIDNHYLMIIPNSTNGYNYFEVFLDRENKIVHLYDGLESYKGGLSAINAINNDILNEFSLLMGVDLKNIIIAIYSPEYTINNVYICIYNSNGFGGNLQKGMEYKPFVSKVKDQLKDRI